MSVLTDLEAALEAKGKAARLLDSLSPFTTVAEDWNDAEADLTATEDDLNCLLTDDTIAALVAVARAAVVVHETDTPFADGRTIGDALDSLYAALAPLVKEADHDRA